MKLSRMAASVAVVSILTACGGGGGSSDSKDSSSIDVDNVQKLLTTNADIAYAAYSDAVTTAEALQTALATFRADPTEANFVAAKQAWLVAREPYGQTEVYRFRLSPIDSTNYTDEDGPEGDINAWPLGEALIDYVQTNTTDFATAQIGVTDNSVEVGTEVDGAYVITADDYDASENIIGRTDIEITADLLANTATADDEHDVIAGYHAIEFLLWGQDLNDDGSTTDGTDREYAVKSNEAYNYAAGGDRPLSDLATGYATEADYDSSDLSMRRHKYLEVAVAKLIDDLTSVRDGWADGASYRTAFTTISTESEAREKLTEILTGMGTLSRGELAGERMQIAFSSNSQEDEHSCFSDNTHRDIWLNAEGVSNSYYGVYAGYDSDLDGVDDAADNAVSGYGFDDYLSDAGMTDLKSAIETALSATAEQYEAIDELARAGTPFDVQIMDATTTEPAYLAIKALNAQATQIENLAEDLGLDGDVTIDDATACDTSTPDAECEE
ncbi:imelysin family protein [Oceanobacter mangrovi]|uniref:imelysin family protein n=1 Tax=Oceanobacter mangrovi TaxID=2862510 RepID=UPI001C8D8298|nr:imelysin family protein [Oceanobacter mangrovi]